MSDRPNVSEMSNNATPGNLPPTEKRHSGIPLFVLMSRRLASKLQIDVSFPFAPKEPSGFQMCYFVYKVITNKVFKKVTCQLLS